MKETNQIQNSGFARIFERKLLYGKKITFHVDLTENWFSEVIIQFHHPSINLVFSQAKLTLIPLGPRNLLYYWFIMLC